MTPQPLRLTVLVGSTREGRFGPTIATWFAQLARAHGEFDVRVVDLAEADLPAVMPASWSSPAISAYARCVEGTDAFVVVTPEYNHSYPAPLKQAIDLVSGPWSARPVGFVSYGGLSGGLRAVEHLRQVIAEIHAVGIRDTVSFHGASRQFGPDGQPLDAVGPAQAATKLLDQLAWWAEALRDARERRPYVA